MAGPYFGKYRAFVRDTKDPLNIGRVKLEVPEILGKVLTDWAFPILSSPAQSESGSFPKATINDQVWAEFEAGNENRPLWSGGWWAQGQIFKLATGEGANDPINAGKGTDVTKLPPKLTGDKTVTEPAGPYAAESGKNMVFKTKEGFVLEVDGTPQHERLNIVHPSGTFIEIHPSGRVVVKVAGGSYKRTNGDEVGHVLGSKADHVEGDAYAYVQGAEAREIEKKSHLLAKKGVVLEDEIGNTLVLDPETGKLTIRAIGNMDIVANGQITMDALAIIIAGRVVTPIRGAPI